MYTVALKSVLGLQLNADPILLKPAISKSWQEYRIELVLDNDKTTYFITIENPEYRQAYLKDTSMGKM